MRERAWMIAILMVAAAGISAVGIVLSPKTPTVIKIGYAISLTGPNAANAVAMTLPNYRLWVKETNDAGGLMLSSLGKRLPIQVAEYDDESSETKALEAIERLIRQDRVDFLLPPWGTVLNIAVGPVFDSGGYPHLAVSAISNRVPELSRLWPNSFWFGSTVTANVEGLVATLERLRRESKINSKAAIVSAADLISISYAKLARTALTKAGFEIAYDRSYPVGTQDMGRLIAEAKQHDPDSFLAFSYPRDTLAITEQARTSGFNPKVFYTALGTASPLFKHRLRAEAEGVMGYGGWNPDISESLDYRKRYIELHGQEPDIEAGTKTYASLQVLQQAIERVGRIDRAAVAKELRTGAFRTVMGKIMLEGNVYGQSWTVGQWQNGEFHGIEPAAQPGARPVLFPKPAWRLPNPLQVLPDTAAQAAP